ncbi:tetratricopeptide repeat protein [Sphingobium aquiterrae]|uniref:tetratricopeptide repeat protein n=1 Tax=Sphingobium aquiterrae TaxID=2038656 RepID=UPI00301B1C84
MILTALLLLQAYSPETEAVMNRSRARAAETRAAAENAAKPAASNGGTAASAAPATLPLPPEVAAKLQACTDAAVADPDRGVAFANAWRLDGGGYHARQCMGFAYARAERWSPAMVAFSQAADEAERTGGDGSGRLWAQAGNAALLGGEPAKAREFFDAAFARGLPDGLEKGEAYLDRARALVALGDMVKARGDLDNAVVQAAPDPLAWLLSATLARRTGNLALARTHIAQAVKLSPDDASVALEEGNIAIRSGQDDIARAAWSRAAKLAPQGDAGKAAADSLSRLEAEAKVPPAAGSK